MSRPTPTPRVEIPCARTHETLPYRQALQGCASTAGRFLRRAAVGPLLNQVVASCSCRAFLTVADRTISKLLCLYPILFHKLQAERNLISGWLVVKVVDLFLWTDVLLRC